MHHRLPALGTYLLLSLVLTILLLGTAGDTGPHAAVQVTAPAAITPEPWTVPAGVPVLMYHSIGEEEGNDAVISPHLFREHMAYLYQHHYHPITLDELYAFLQENKPLPPQPVIITFDDGYRDTWEIAWPVLQQYGFRGVLFIPASEIGQRLQREELQAMRAGGMEIGAHSYTHRELTSLSPAEQAQEIKQAKAVLDAALGQDTKYFCYPNGRYSQETLRLLRTQGFVLAFTTEPGWAQRGDNPLTLRRVWLGNGVDLPRLEERLSRPDYPLL